METWGIILLTFGRGDFCKTMKLHLAFLGQEETSKGSTPRWSQSNCHCWEVPFGKYASIKLMLLPVSVCHFLTKDWVLRGRKNPETPGRAREGKVNNNVRNISENKKMTFSGLVQTKFSLSCVTSWRVPKGQASGRKKNPSYVRCTPIIHKTFAVKCCQSNLTNRENDLMHPETWKPPIMSPTCCFPTFSALSHLAATAVFLTSVCISLICFLVYLTWLKRKKNRSRFR